MFGRQKEISIPREYGPLFILTATRSLTGNEVIKLARQALVDLETQRFRTLAQITESIELTNGKLSSESILHFVGINYKPKKSENPDSTIEERMHFDLRRLQETGYIVTSDNNQLFSITSKGVEHAETKITELKHKIAPQT